MSRNASGLVRFAVLSLAAAICVAPAGAANVCTWKGATGDWSDGAQWTNGVPQSGDQAIINAGSVLITSASADNLASFTMNGGTLTFSNWSTKISATNISILGSAQVTLPPAFLNAGPSNRVWFACTNFFLDSNASINGDDKGYAAVLWSPGNGPGGGTASIGGGGYGGRGSCWAGPNGGLTYGSMTAPEAPGSGGAADGNYDGGNGGGAVRIEAPGGNVTVNGTISANGGNTSGDGDAYRGYNGSGGGVYINCRTFAGTNGAVKANAGKDSWTSVGGGGRIAVVYDTTAQAAMPKPRVLFSAAKGPGAYPVSTCSIYTPQDLGTIYFPDASILDSSWLPHTGQIWMASSVWNVSSLTISNGWIRFPADGFQLTVTNSALITGTSGKLELGGDEVSVLQYVGEYEFINCSATKPTLAVGGNLVLTNGGSLVVYSAPTNGAATSYGALVSVTGDVFIADTSYIYPHSNPTNGGSVLLRMNNLTVAGPGGGINADYRGYRKALYENVMYTVHSGYGPGGGPIAYAAGGYGGIGPDYNGTTPGQTYGSSNAPVAPGSAGGISNTGDSLGGNGGGSIRIEATGTVTIKGPLSANGQRAYNVWGGGSGGGIYIRCKRFDGNASGSLQANGGSGGVPPAQYQYGGGGGGGRIAVWRVTDMSGGAVSASVSVDLFNPNSRPVLPEPGTVVWGQLPPPLGVISQIR